MTKLRMNFARVSTVSTTTAVVDQLRQMIITRELEIGQSLPPERELANVFGVSRNAVREALGILGQRGLVRAAPGRGRCVTSPSGESIRSALDLMLVLGGVRLVDLCDARLQIEPQLARLAAQNTRSASTAYLRSLLDELEASQTEPQAHVKADIAFHKEIARLANNEFLAVVVDAFSQPIQVSMHVGLHVGQSLDVSDQQHTAIRDAISAGDGELAAEAMRAHISFIRDYISEVST